jgi:two-component system sensor histidine kinase TctE
MPESGVARGIRARASRWAMRTRMLALLFVGLALLAGADFSWQYRRATQSITAAHNRALARVAAGYLRALRGQDADTTKIPTSVFQEELGADSAPKLLFRVSGEQNELLGGADQLPPPPATNRETDLVQAQYYAADVAGIHYFVVTVRDFLLMPGYSKPVLVQVAEPQSARDDAMRHAGLAIAAQTACQYLVVMLLAALAITVGQRPLAKLRRELRAHKPAELTLHPAEWPRELEPLIAAMGELLAEQRASVDQQQKFLADASHQLRTPVAVLKTLAQGALFGQTDPIESLNKMLSVIDRTSGLTDQLLSLAKAEQLVSRGDWHPVALDSVAKSVAVELAPLIARKHLDFSLQSAPVSVNSDAWMLGQLVKNLVANAINHSKQGGAIGIVIRRLHADAELIVWDRGEGVDEDVLERLFEPFNVAKGSSGIGLGLSICRQIADSMNASVHLFNRIEAGATVGVDAMVRWHGVVDPAQRLDHVLSDHG